jgi:hypothetical protein
MMKKTLILLSLFLFAFAFGYSQTNVSGGIYTNTTWTKAKSPYIITDTVVVFPGVTLTIQPGVTVKFANNIRLELRQATLIAEGTSTDSITFTSNSAVPYAGIWNSVLFNGANTSKYSRLNHCNFLYAQVAVYDPQNFSVWYRENLSIRNCLFKNNTTGIYIDLAYYGCLYADSCTFSDNTTAIYAEDAAIFINRCNISHNNTGIYCRHSSIKSSIINYNINGIVADDSYDTISNCVIKYNEIGIQNSGLWSSGHLNIIKQNIIKHNNIGIKLLNIYNSVNCNYLCHNTTYDFSYNVSGTNINIPNNNWCTGDSSFIVSRIYDGYDNINFGLVSFLPVDNGGCNLPADTSEDSLFHILLPADMVVCYGTTLHIASQARSAKGTIRYVWSTSPLDTLSYKIITVTIDTLLALRATDGLGHASSDSIYIKVNAKPSRPIISLAPSDFFIECNLLNGNYHWFYRPDTLSLPTPITTNSRRINPKIYCKNCYYSVVYTDANGCISDTSAPYYFNVNSVKQNDRTTQLVIYPNPATTELFISLEDKTDKINLISIFDILGHKVADYPAMNCHNCSINTEMLEKSVYLLKIETVKGKNARLSFIKK